MTQRRFDIWFMWQWLKLWPEKPVTIKWLASKVKCNAVHLGQVIRGNRNPTRELLEECAATLNLPYDYENGGAAGWFWFPVPENMKGKGKINET